MDNYVNFRSVNGKRKILVVEDEIINQELLKMILKDTYDLIIAGTGADALKAAEEEHDTLSLVLLDLNLPDRKGLDVLRQFKSDEILSRLPVIVMTAERDLEVESLNLGAIDFIPKPYPQPKVILARVQRTIELSEDKDIISYTERDKLTGLYNREYFYRYASQFDTYHPDLSMDAIVVDINHFHMLNERYGKAYCDELLVDIGKKLKDLVKEENGIVCRMESDTFLVYCPHIGDYEGMLESLSSSSDKQEHVRMRMGVYSDTDKSVDMERRFDRAKSAADTVRNSFTGSVGLYDDSFHESEMYNEQLLESFSTAIREEQFQVYYQPKFNVTGEDPVLSSAEALVRWFHPELGMISPGVFIPLFEKNGLIEELDSYVWRKAAAQIMEWKKELGITVPVSVNVSRIDMYDPDLPELFDRLVKDYSLGHNEIILEITESAYTENSEQIIAMVDQLRSKGFRIEMDDFGTGYSSLNMITSLPIDALKLDMQFIRNAFKKRKDTRLLEVVISLADSLGVPTIAEGVETAEQMFTLKTMGCDIVQGYFFSKPLPAKEFGDFALKAEREAREAESRRRNSKRNSDRHTYDALHDPLTGMYNHSAFDILFKDSDQDHIAVLIASIDDYETMKNKYGQKYADEMVLKASSILRNNFRNVDDICRLKEDEFVVIMTRVQSSMKQLVYEKVETISKLMNRKDENGPALTVSFGVAFSDSDPDSNIFEDADKALQRSKEKGKGTCEVHC